MLAGVKNGIPMKLKISSENQSSSSLLMLIILIVLTSILSSFMPRRIFAPGMSSAMRMFLNQNFCWIAESCGAIKPSLRTPTANFFGSFSSSEIWSKENWCDDAFFSISLPAVTELSQKVLFKISSISNCDRFANLLASLSLILAQHRLLVPSNTNCDAIGYISFDVRIKSGDHPEHVLKFIIISAFASGIRNPSSIPLSLHAPCGKQVHKISRHIPSTAFPFSPWLLQRCVTK